MGYKEGDVFSTKNDQIYIPKVRYNLNEAQNVMDIVTEFPINKRINYDRAKMVQAIQNGMVILILYEGDKDDYKGGRERVIQPLVVGINKNTKNELIRGFHLEGYSVSQKKETKKVWRLFKASNILGMMFTGHFFRLPPKGYKMNDRVMSEKTIAKADFNTIRRNQETLIRAGKIEKQEEAEITKKTGTSSIIVKNTGTMLNLKDPWSNEIIKDSKKTPSEVRVSVLKTIFTNEYIVVLGALGEVNKTVKVYEEKKLLGNYRTIASFTGDNFNKYKQVNNITEFDVYTFEKKN